MEDNKIKDKLIEKKEEILSDIDYYKEQLLKSNLKIEIIDEMLDDMEEEEEAAEEEQPAAEEENNLI